MQNKISVNKDRIITKVIPQIENPEDIVFSKFLTPFVEDFQPLNDLYIACSYQRFTELIDCMMNIIEKGYFDFAEAQAPKAWVGNDGKIRVYDGAHRILMCYLIGLKCAFVDLQRHETGISREVEKEREALAFVGDNSRTRQIPWYQNWQAYLDYNKETEEYAKSKMLLDFFILSLIHI